MTTPTGEHIIRDVYFILVEEEEYADVAARESRPIGWKVAREGRTRKVASEGRGSKELSLSLRGRARYSAKRRPFGREARWYRADFCVLRGAEVCVFSRKGEMDVNFQANMVPGICAMIVGALLTFGAGRLCRKEKDIPQVKLIGVGLAVIGALTVFLV